MSNARTDDQQTSHNTGNKHLDALLAKKEQAHRSKGHSQKDIAHYTHALKLSFSGRHDEAVAYVQRPEVIAAFKALGMLDKDPGPRPPDADMPRAAPEEPAARGLSMTADMIAAGGQIPGFNVVMRDALWWWDRWTLDDAIELLLEMADWLTEVRTSLNRYPSLIAIGPSMTAAFGVGGTTGKGIIFYSDLRVGFYGTVGDVAGFIGGISSSLQFSWVKGHDFSGIFIGVGISGGDPIAVGLCALMDAQNSPMGFTMEVGIGLGLPVSVYVSVTDTVVEDLD